MADFDWGGLLGGLVGAGASMYSANKQADAAKKAAEAQTNAAQSALAQSQAANAPYAQAGNMAIGQLMDVMSGKSNLSSDPGTLYAMQQGQKAIERAAAARGNVGSARTMSELMRNATDYGQTGYNNAWNRLAGMAGVGQNATGSNVNLIGSLLPQIGNAQAASNIAGTNARTSGYLGAAGSLGDWATSKNGASSLSSLYDNIFRPDYGKTVTGQKVSGMYGNAQAMSPTYYADQGENPGGW
jgi:hypothetical protein